jgi:hypothetical protein
VRTARGLPVLIAIGACALDRQGHLEDATAASTTTSAGGGADGGGGSNVVTGGMGGGVEDCLDGADNDGDGLVDCADPACVPGFECVPAAPEGWTGPYRVRRTAFPASLVPCGDGAVAASYFQDPAGPAACTACTCGGWSGATCGPPTLQCWDGAGCSSITTTTFALPDLGCQDAPPSLADGGGPRSCAIVVGAALTAEGSCPPSGVSFPNTAPWATQVDVCLEPAAGAGCDRGLVCVPAAGPDYGEACVLKSGDDACPASHPNESALHDGVLDDRGCNACTCTVQGASCTGGHYVVFNSDGCSPDPNNAAVSGPCLAVTGILDDGTGSVQAHAGTPANGACAAGGGTPFGSVVPTGPATLCCP